MLLGINGSKVDTVWKPLCEIEVLKTRKEERKKILQQEKHAAKSGPSSSIARDSRRLNVSLGSGGRGCHCYSVTILKILLCSRSFDYVIHIIMFASHILDNRSFGFWFSIDGTNN